MFDAGALLREARHRSGLSQRQLARRTGLAQPTISRLESGRAVPRADRLARLLEACGYQLLLEPRPREASRAGDASAVVVERGDDVGRGTDPVIEAYKQGVDRTLLRQNLARSVAQRMENLVALQRLAQEARRAGRVVAAGESVGETAPPR